MSNGYHTMQNVAAHGGAPQARREDFSMRRPAVPQQAQQASCHFPEPQPMRVYCQPAAFHRVNGQEYQNMSVAYGQSRQLERYF